MWAFFSIIFTIVVLIFIFLPTLGFWSLPVGLLIGWIIKKFIINPNDPLQPTYQEQITDKNPQPSIWKSNNYISDEEQSSTSKHNNQASKDSETAASVFEKAKSIISMKENKICPFCSETIKKKAIKCRFCGEWLDEKST